MEVYRHPRSMEPLLPAGQGSRLAELTCQILTESGRLTGRVHSPHVLREVAALVREMNSYYSNLIEGHKTTPRDLERAKRNDFASNETDRNNQHLSLAHIEVETLIDQRLDAGTTEVHSPGFLQWIHQEFYSRLPDSLHWARTTTGQAYRIEPGQFRTFMVDVGRHTPPAPESVPRFLGRFGEFYGDPQHPATAVPVAIAAAHHRLAWIHPFGDGNGRVTRLHSHALLRHHGIDGRGLWTLSRGLARSRDLYFARLAGADQGRRGDLDGRGNLSDEGLAMFCVFFLETILDQVRFMGDLLELPSLRTRVERHFQFEALHLRRYREELMRVARVLVDEGEIPRARVREITGKQATVSVEIIKLGLAEGYFTSPSPKGPLRVAFPPQALAGYFPKLYLDLPIGGR